jgi:L-lactate permease
MSPAWSQSYALFGRGLAFSALIASLPILTLLFLLGVLRKPAWLAALSALVVAFVVALFAYSFPPALAFSSAANGAAFGLFPISWIVFWAITLYRVTVETGKFEIIKSSMGNLTSDARLQALLIAFAFGAFVEGAAGFGTPVAVAAAMLVGLGFSPFYASALCLVANTAPVAFGSIGIPVVTLAGITGLPLEQLSGAVGRLCAPLSLLVPAYLVCIMVGWRGMLEVWPAALVVGGVFASVQFLMSNFVGPQLTDIMSSLTALAALLLLLRFWRPATMWDRELESVIPEGSGARRKEILVARPRVRRSETYGCPAFQRLDALRSAGHPGAALGLQAFSGSAESRDHQLRLAAPAQSGADDAASGRQAYPL